MRRLIFDVAVIGGGPAGVAAAISASAVGVKTILIERNSMFGGQATSSQVAAFCGFYTRGKNPDLAIGGVGKKILDKMEKYGFDTRPYPSKSTGNTNIKFNPEIMKVILDEMLLESGIELRLHTTLVATRIVENKIQEIECLDDEGIFIVEAKQFIDATGNANLVHLSNIPTVWGDEKGEVQQASLVFKLSNLPKRDILNKELEVAILKGKQAGIPNLFKEKGMIIKREFDDIGYCTIPSVLIKDLSSSTLTTAEIDLRKQVKAYADTFRKYVEACENIEVVQSGPQLGVREARRIIGEDILMGKDILNAIKREDSIGRAAWSVEIHKSDINIEYVYLPDNDYASIPFGILKVKDKDNIWAAGRIVSTDHIAFGSVRVMGTSMVTGQAAGVAAALSCKNKMVNVQQVREVLSSQGALI